MSEERVRATRVFLVSRSRDRLVIAAALIIGLLHGARAFAAGNSGPSELTLDHALAIARRNNPDLAAAAQELKIAHGELTKARYLFPFNPEVASEGDYRPRTNQSNTQDWRVGLSQEIEMFGQRGLRIKSANLNLTERQLLLDHQFRLLAAAVKLTFFDACRARAQVELLHELAALDQRLFKAARVRFTAGEIGRIDFNLAQVRYGESERALIEGTEVYRLQRSSLGRLLGEAAGPEPVPAMPGAPQLPDFKIEQLLERALQQRPDLRAREFEVSRLDAEAALNQRLALPNFKVGAFGGHELNTEYPMGLQLGFNVPLFNRRQGEAEIIQGQKSRAEALLRANQLDVAKQVRDSYSSYLAARESLSIYQKDVIQPASESFGLLERAFSAGKIDLLKLSVVEREAFQARMSYLDALFNVNSARVSVELATAGRAR